jgi:hypothetical protein
MAAVLGVSGSMVIDCPIIGESRGTEIFGRLDPGQWPRLMRWQGL